MAFSAGRVAAAIAAYRQFLELKAAVGDEDATALLPPLPVDIGNKTTLRV